MTGEEARRPTAIDSNHWCAVVSLIGEDENEVMSSEESDMRNYFGILKVKKCCEHAVIPTRGSEGAAGYDLCSAEDSIVPCLSDNGSGRTKVKTGFRISMPPRVYGRLAPRSGLAVN